VSHVLQWNTNVSDFNAASNSSGLNLTVWFVIVGTDNIKLHAVAHESSGWLQFSSICLRRPCIALPGTKVNVLVLGRSGAAPARPGLSIPDGSANPRLQTDDTQNLREDCGLREVGHPMRVSFFAC